MTEVRRSQRLIARNSAGEELEEKKQEAPTVNDYRALKLLGVLVGTFLGVLLFSFSAEGDPLYCLSWFCLPTRTMTLVSALMSMAFALGMAAGLAHLALSYDKREYD